MGSGPKVRSLDLGVRGVAGSAVYRAGLGNRSSWLLPLPLGVPKADATSLPSEAGGQSRSPSMALSLGVVWKEVLYGLGALAY